MTMICFFLNRSVVQYKFQTLVFEMEIIYCMLYIREFFSSYKLSCCTEKTVSLIYNQEKKSFELKKIS